MSVRIIYLYLYRDVVHGFDVMFDKFLLIKVVVFVVVEVIIYISSNKLLKIGRAHV